MDIREMLEKCKPFAPVVSAAVVAACVAGSLYGYKVPVYETKASVEDTQEQAVSYTHLTLPTKPIV